MTTIAAARAFARYGKLLRYGASLTFTPSPSRVLTGSVERWREHATDHQAQRDVDHVVGQAAAVGEPGGIAAQQAEPVGGAGAVGATPVFSRSRSATGPAGVPGAAIGGA